MRRLAVSVCVIALVTALAAGSVAARGTTASRGALSSRETALVVAINAVRTLHLLPALRIDRHLLRAARAHSRDMLRKQYFAHGDFGERMSAFHVSGTLFAENLVWGSGVMSAAAAVAAWLASPPHRANLLDPSLRRIGVATPLGQFDGFSTATMITADFAGG
jgi:uncharacterized protein YkwD